METRAKRAKQLTFNYDAWFMWGLVLQFVPWNEVNDVLCISRNLHEFSIPIRSLVVLWYGNALTAIQRKTMVGIGSCDKGIRDADLKHLKGIHTLDLSWCDQITEKGGAFESSPHVESPWLQPNHRQGIKAFERGQHFESRILLANH